MLSMPRRANLQRSELLACWLAAGAGGLLRGHEWHRRAMAEVISERNTEFPYRPCLAVWQARSAFSVSTAQRTIELRESMSLALI